MKKTKYYFIAGFLFLCTMAVSMILKSNEPWKPNQLLDPKALAEILNHSDRAQPLIISVGPAGPIKGSLEVGSASEKENLETLRKHLAKEAKDRHIVIYCGCCPFKDCPNIRPAFSLLNQMHFTRHQLLDLPKNLKTDWIDKGYPVNL